MLEREQKKNGVMETRCGPYLFLICMFCFFNSLGMFFSVHELEDKLASSMMGDLGDEDHDDHHGPSSGMNDKKLEAEVRRLTQQLEQWQVNFSQYSPLVWETFPKSFHARQTHVS